MAALLASLAMPEAVQAAAGPWLDHEQARVRLIAASDSTGREGPLRLGLQFELQPGWKIYWRSPGDAGYPPSLDWSRSENLVDAHLRWPVPHRFSLFGLETFGYSDEVVLPILALPSRPGEPLALRAALNYLICAEVCVPHDGILTLDLPAGPGAPSPHALLIDRFDSLVPGDGSAVGLSLERAHLIEGAEEPILEVVARSSAPFDSPDLLVEGPPGFLFDRPEVTLGDGGRRALLRLPSARGPQAEGALEGKPLTLTLTDGRRGLEAEVIGRFAAPAGQLEGAGLADRSFLAILALALLGGLILNLMPCVLPVLSIKLLSVVSHGGRDRGAVRLSFLASAAGIVFSFLLLAAVAAGLKGAGLAAGWGIQFQQPLFLSAMAVVVTLFACNLFGLFEIRLPGAFSDAAVRASGSGPGGPGAGGFGLGGPFLTGAFATLLATPCSAPFLGTAVGFALARGAAEIFLVFAALGLGLALPYLLVAAAPALAARLPRPGPWMIWLRRLLGLALLGTAAWLLSVLVAQSGLSAALAVGALLVALCALLLLRHLRRRPAAAALAGLAALLAFAVPAAFPGAERTATPMAAEATWRPLDRAEIATLVAQGRVVFVDITADWCITCQVNKNLVIDREPVAGRLAADSVVAMRGDWTRPSEAIADYLASFGRYGIPFNAVYGPGLPDGEILPELLTREAVLDALDRARGEGVALAGQ